MNFRVVLSCSSISHVDKTGWLLRGGKCTRYWLKQGKLQLGQVLNCSEALAILIHRAVLEKSYNGVVVCSSWIALKTVHTVVVANLQGLTALPDCWTTAVTRPPGVVAPCLQSSGTADDATGKAQKHKQATATATRIAGQRIPSLSRRAQVDKYYGSANKALAA